LDAEALLDRDALQRMNDFSVTVSTRRAQLAEAAEEFLGGNADAT
jgi:hypothetical protein